MTNLWVPDRRHAATFLLASIPLFVASLVGLATGNLVLVIAPLAIAVTPVIIAFVLWCVCLRWDRCLRALEAEDAPILHWTYPRDQWARHVELLGRKARRLGPWLGIGLFLLGVFVAVLISFDETMHEESTLLLWLYSTGSGAFAGAYLWFLVSWNVASTRGEQLRRGGELLLGRNGFYLTGEYRPLSGFGQTLTGVRYEDGEVSRLVFSWYVSSGRHSSYPEVVVPVPPGREDEARAAVETLAAEINGRSRSR